MSFLSSRLRALGLFVFISALAPSHVLAAPPTLDLTNGPAIKAAAGQALSNLLKYYTPNKVSQARNTKHGNDVDF